MATGKTIALTRQTLVGKVMSLLFNILSMFVIVFLPRSVFKFQCCSHHLSDFGAQLKKSVTVSIVSQSICHEGMGPDANYSAMKRNKIVSVVVMWMNLESVKQSEVSQKENNIY